MKMNFSIDIDNSDIDDVESEIIQEAAKQVINEVLSNRYEHHGRTFKDKLKDEIETMLTNIMDTDFKNEVKDALVLDLEKKYIRTKQYKEVKEQFEILSETEIKAGLKDFISDIVKAEIRAKFKWNTEFLGGENMYKNDLKALNDILTNTICVKEQNGIRKMSWANDINQQLVYVNNYETSIPKGSYVKYLEINITPKYPDLNKL